MAEEIAVGDLVTVRKSANVPLSFKGTVQKLYVNSAMLTIDSFDDGGAHADEEWPEAVADRRSGRGHHRATGAAEPDVEGAVLAPGEAARVRQAGGDDRGAGRQHRCRCRHALTRGDQGGKREESDKQDRDGAKHDSAHGRCSLRGRRSRCGASNVGAAWSRRLPE